MSPKPTLTATKDAPVANNPNPSKSVILWGAAALFAIGIASEEISHVAMHQINQKTLSKLAVMYDSGTLMNNFSDTAGSHLKISKRGYHTWSG